ncbi:small-conductance mechanosensitive channel [Nitrosospira sp. Nsp2]|uniref:mechanosensitive ion channel domain-containing protein n=1 Tax=Nitrosospira sp. Nsp2 TaxID=136548 RepID=UPI000D47DDB8|nr:mechanosensitive ion channel domain-containing protein [Nitrosospira sp. Nsp2]PTR16185.1 small-conductance mechanosensitive channel [Nitrosospira sp. Nsp2]
MNLFAAILAPFSLAFSLAIVTPPDALANEVTKEVTKGTGGEISASPPPVTPAQAQRALSILQDEKKRTELEETLAAIAQATAIAPASAPATSPPRAAGSPSTGEQAPLPIQLTENGLVAQVFDLIATRLDVVVDQLRLTGRMFLEVKTVGEWWQYNLGVPERRAVVLDALWQVILTLAGALLAEWLARRVLARLRKLVENRAAARKAAIDQKKIESARTAAPEGRHRAEAVPETRAADRHWRLLRRLPFAFAHWVLGLIPLVVFFVVAIVLLNAAGGRSAPFYGPTLVAVSAYATTRFVLSVIQLMASPLGQGLRLMHISDGVAAFLYRWLRWVVVVAVFGTAIADISLETGATQNTHDTLTKLVALAVHVMLLIMIFRSREATAAAIRGRAGDGHDVSGLRGMLADSWLFVATFLIAAAWLLWSAGTENGFQHVLHVFGWSAAVIVVASLVSIFVLGAIDRAFISNRENMQQQLGQRPPGELEPEAAPKTTYHMLVYRAVSSIIGIVALILLLQVWGVDTHSWFEEGSIGRRLASALVTIAVTCMLALAAWEALNKAVCNRIELWSEEGDIARAARLRTLVPMLRACLFFVIGMVVLLAALHQLGINIGPLLAGASIIGVALGFGSQKLVQDFITGIFLLMENAIQVGDFITVADVSGSVEYLSIRTVRLRAPDGSLHVVPFSSVSTVTNTNRGLGNASVRVSVKADSDVDRVFAAIRGVGEEMRADPQLKDLILADLEIWGVDQVDGAMITVLGQIRTLDKGRWPVQRAFNQRILERFRELDIHFVNPQERHVVTQPRLSPARLQPQPDRTPELALPRDRDASMR